MECLWSLEVDDKNEEKNDNTTIIIDQEPPDSLLPFSRDEFNFVQELPSMIDIECPICLQVMLNKPHLTSCCGRHFCGPCLRRVRKNKTNICPLCKTKNFRAFIDKNRHRIIRELEVYCVNNTNGCVWKGELKNLPSHVNRGEREGECKVEIVHCRYSPKSFWWDNWWGDAAGQLEGNAVGTLKHEEGCNVEGKRDEMETHEREECLYRPYKCQYCDYNSTYKDITQEHAKLCNSCPVYCPNDCSQTTFNNFTLNKHLCNECPLQPVQCELNWVGCREQPLRKDLSYHVNDHGEHYSLLMSFCKKLVEENKDLKTENKVLKSENELLKSTYFKSTK